MSKNVEEALLGLKEISKKLNELSDILAASIQRLEAKLQSIHLGVSAWHVWSQGDTFDNSVGYAKVGKRWCIAIRHRTFKPELEPDEIYPFNEAPRWMRVEAVSSIPDLLDTLLVRAGEMSMKISMANSRVAKLLDQLEDK